MHNPRQAATDVVLRELLGIVTKPLVDGFDVKQDTPSSTAANQEPPTRPELDGDPPAEDGDGIDINNLLGMRSEKTGDGFVEHEGSRGRSLTDIASQSIPATRTKSPRKKRKKRGRR